MSVKFSQPHAGHMEVCSDVTQRAGDRGRALCHRGIRASWNVKETELGGPSPQSKPRSKAVEKLLASRREGSVCPNSVYNALEAWPAKPQKGGCGKYGKTTWWQGF